MISFCPFLVGLSFFSRFTNGAMMEYNVLIRHLDLPFERFCADVCYEGRDFEKETEDLPNKVLLVNKNAFGGKIQFFATLFHKKRNFIIGQQ